MAENNMVIFNYGTQAGYEAIVTKEDASLYFITDKHKIYRGNDLIVETNVAFTTVAPVASNTDIGILYVYTDGDGNTSTWAKNSDGNVSQVGGGEAKAVANGILNVSNFDENSIAKNIETNPASASDTKLTTEKAVSTLVDNIKNGLQTQIDSLGTNFNTVKDAFVNVSIDESTTEGKFNLNFYKASSPTENPISVELDKEQYLLDADISENGQNLVLTIQIMGTDGAPPTQKTINVPLGDLIATAKTVKTVDAAIDVQLGDGATLGGYKTGDTIAVGTPIQTVIAKLLAKQVPPTYKMPVISLANNGGSKSDIYEIGTNVTPKLSATFTQNNGGALNSIQFKENGTVTVGDTSSASPATYTGDSFQLTETVTYTAVASYEQGPVLNDNLGEPYPTGQIAANNNLVSGAYTFTPYRTGYFIGSTVDTGALSSAVIRGLQVQKKDNYSSGTVDFTIPVEAARIIIACPSNFKGMTEVFNDSIKQPVTSTFVGPTKINVEGAEGYTAIEYNVWTYTPLSPYDQSQNIIVTLG